MNDNYDLSYANAWQIKMFFFCQSCIYLFSFSGELVQGLHFPNSSAILARSLTPNARFIVILRDPVTRIYSQYKMHQAVSPQHFHEGVTNAINEFNACVAKEGYSERCCYGNLQSYSQNRIGRSSFVYHLRMGIYHVYLREWLSVFPNKNRFLIIKAESYYTNMYGYITDTVFPFLELAPVHDKKTKECIEDRPPAHVVSRKLKKDPNAVDKSYSAPMLDVTKQMLYAFYEPHNKALAQLLGDNQWTW